MKNFSILSVIITSILISGCATQRILSVQDHPTLPLTKVETLRTKSFLFTKSVQHQFWLCKDEGASMACDLQCGGDTDLACPQAIAGSNNSNVQ